MYWLTRVCIHNYVSYSYSSLDAGQGPTFLIRQDGTAPPHQEQSLSFDTEKMKTTPSTTTEAPTTALAGLSESQYLPDCTGWGSEVTGV